MSDEPRTEGEDELEIELRSPVEVAARVIVLAAVCRRAFLEARPDDAGEDAEAERFDLAAWLRDEGIDGAVTDRERRLLGARLGSLDPDEATDASWQSEALAALGWALGLLDPLPPYDAPADPALLLALLPAPWDQTATFRREASLRDEETIAAERERAELWHWRAEAAEEIAASGAADRAALAGTVLDVAAEARTAGLLSSLAAGDFPARGRPFRELDPEVVAEIALLAEHRLRALNWLCGFGPTWHDVPLDV